MPRTKPEGLYSYQFSLFEKWADKNDIGIDELDYSREPWLLWWECWLDGFLEGKED